MTNDESAGRVDARLGALTLEEKCRLLGGASTWRTHAIDRVGIPALRMSDGPNGVRGETLGVDRTPGVTVPVGIALGATWDPELIEEIGDLLGREAIRKGVHVLLAPTINLARTPVGGRVFECYSEDPELTAKLATAFVRGVQSNDVAVTVKHFVANDTERDRMTVDVHVDERPLRELYLRPFEAVVRDGRAWGIMSAYNKLAGEFCAANSRLLTEILREEWGFDGFVVSDWLGAHDTIGSANAGLTVPMPGPVTIYGDQLRSAVGAGKVAESTVDALVRQLLVLIERTRADERSADRKEQSVDDPADRELCRRAAVAATVLVRNERALLPLDAGTIGRVAVVGPNAADTRTMGGGSSNLEPLSQRSVLDALTDRLDAEIAHEPGVRIDKLAPLVRDAALVVEYRDGEDPQGPIVRTDHPRSGLLTYFGSAPLGVEAGSFHVTLTGRLVPVVDGPHTFGVVAAGRPIVTIAGQEVIGSSDRLARGDAFFGFGSEEQFFTVEATAGEPIEIEASMVVRGFGALRIGLRRPDPPNLFERAVDAARGADAAILVVGTNDEWETEGEDRDTISLPGRQDELISAVAAVNPRTVVVINAGAPVAMPWLDEVGAVLIGWFGGLEMAEAIVDVLVGDADPGGRLPVSYPRELGDVAAWEHYLPDNGVQTYGEGLQVGYRGLDAGGVEPLVAFGHGLTYGDIEWNGTDVSPTSIEPDGEVVVRLDLINRADRPGTEVVQGYVVPIDPPVIRPPKELRVWAKVTLDAGQITTAKLTFAAEAFRRWDDERSRWVVDSGRYDIVLARSAARDDEERRIAVEIT